MHPCYSCTWILSQSYWFFIDWQYIYIKLPLIICNNYIKIFCLFLHKSPSNLGGFGKRIKMETEICNAVESFLLQCPRHCHSHTWHFGFQEVPDDFKWKPGCLLQETKTWSCVRTHSKMAKRINHVFAMAIPEPSEPHSNWKAGSSRMKCTREDNIWKSSTRSGKILLWGMIRKSPLLCSQVLYKGGFSGSVGKSNLCKILNVGIITTCTTHSSNLEYLKNTILAFQNTHDFFLVVNLLIFFCWVKKTFQ